MDGLQMIRAIIFDLDGTLVHSLPGLATALNRVLEQHGLPTHPESRVRGFIGDGIAKLLERGCPDNLDPSQMPAIAKDMDREYAAAWREGSPPFPGIIETLAELKSAGYKLAIFSNKPDSFCQDFANHLFPDTFDAVLGQRPGVPTKPDPAGALDTARLMETQPEEILFLGDSVMDIATAKRAKMLAVAATWGYHDQPRLENENPDQMIHDIKELIPLLKKLA